MSDFQRKSSIENFSRESALKEKKLHKDTLKASLKDFNIFMGSWEQIAQERSKWRELIVNGAALYEK